MKKLEEYEKRLVNKSFLSEKLAFKLLPTLPEDIDEVRLLYLLRKYNQDYNTLVDAYQAQQAYIEKYKEDFMLDNDIDLEEEVPPMIVQLVNPLIAEIYMHEEAFADYIIEKESL